MLRLLAPWRRLHLQSGLDLEGLAITAPEAAPDAAQPLAPMLQSSLLQAMGVSVWMNESTDRLRMAPSRFTRRVASGRPMTAWTAQVPRTRSEESMADRVRLDPDADALSAGRCSWSWTTRPAILGRSYSHQRASTSINPRQPPFLDNIHTSASGPSDRNSSDGHRNGGIDRTKTGPWLGPRQDLGPRT